MAEQQSWVPLESNPEVINRYLENLGVSKNVQCYDLVGFDPDCLAMIPNKAAAVLFLYPSSQKIDEAAKQFPAEPVEGVYFIKQNVKNACGTIALIHALANNEKNLDFGDGCFKLFYEKTKSASPEEKASILESDEEMRKAHEKSAVEGDTQAPDRNAIVDFHFVAFVNCDGVLYELDGCKDHPVKRGETSDGTFFNDAAKICKAFTELEPENIKFTAMALTVAN